MSKIITFADAGVLITGARGNLNDSAAALAVLTDPSRVFCASRFLELEVRPKAIYNKKTNEAEFYETFFDDVQLWADSDAKFVTQAFELASTYGLGGFDALHAVAALKFGAELITTEKPTKPIFRIPSLNVSPL